MRRFNDNEYVDIYNDFNNKLHIPGHNGSCYILEPKDEDGDILYTSVLWRDVKALNTKSNVLKSGRVRFEETIEADAYAQLKIFPNKERNYYTREKIEDMFINPNDEVLREIVSINNVQTMEKFLSIYIGLKNSNEYFLAEKIEIYIRARLQELKEGQMKSELLVTPTKNEVEVIVDVQDEEIEEVVEEEKPKKTTKKRTVTKKTT